MFCFFTNNISVKKNGGPQISSADSNLGPQNGCMDLYLSSRITSTVWIFVEFWPNRSVLIYLFYAINKKFGGDGGGDDDDII